MPDLKITLQQGKDGAWSGYAASPTLDYPIDTEAPTGALQALLRALSPTDT